MSLSRLPVPFFCSRPAQVADLVLLMVDAKFGFEMEQFELLNMLQTHGFPKASGGGGFGSWEEIPSWPHAHLSAAGHGRA